MELLQLLIVVNFLAFLSWLAGSVADELENERVGTVFYGLGLIFVLIELIVVIYFGFTNM